MQCSVHFQFQGEGTVMERAMQLKKAKSLEFQHPPTVSQGQLFDAQLGSSNSRILLNSFSNNELGY